MADTHRLPLPVIEVWEWQRRAACRGMDSLVFFHPERQRGAGRRRREENAKRICGSCPVIDECRRHALSAQEPYGVWGGLSEDERWAMIREP